MAHILPPQPTNPREAVIAYEGCRRRAEQLLALAQTPADRMEAQMWIDNADRNLERWRSAAERGGR